MAADWAEAGLPTNGRHLDLWEANVLQLTAPGVSESHIAVSRHCTICGGRFFSHRAHADGARNMALVMI
jgi:copper oxidase (laccase) domain-containing protein